MDYRLINNRQALNAEKHRVLDELKQSSKDLNTNVKVSFMPVRHTVKGTRIDYNKIFSYALFAYRGFIWTRKISSLFSKKRGRGRKK